MMRKIVDDNYKADPVDIVILNDNTSGRDWGKFTDMVIMIVQGSSRILLDSKGLKELQRVIGANLKC